MSSPRGNHSSTLPLVSAESLSSNAVSEIMQILSSAVFLVLVGAALAEPVRRPAFQRQTAPASAAAAPDADADADPAPYPASGWKPAGPQFQYGPPAVPAEPTTTETPETTTTPPEDASTPAPASKPAKLQAQQQQQQQQQAPVSGVYYVLLEDGRLQQVVFTAEPQPQPEAQQYQQQLPQRLQTQTPQAAQLPRPARIQLQLQDVEPIRGPVYAYTGPLQRILRQA